MCEELSYTEEQLNRIRKELRYLYGYKKKSKNGYSWQDLINEIMEMVDGLCSGDMQKIPKCCRKKLNFDVNEKRFLKFVKGLPNNLKPGGRHFQKLKSCDHLAVELYLTDPDNGYSGLTTEQLYDRDADSKIPLLLAQYLNKSTNEPSQNSFQKMKGAFSSEIKKGNNDCVSVLTINSSINDHVLIADLHNEESLTQSKNKKTLILDGVLNCRPTYSGWLVISPEDNMFFLMKHNYNGVNRIYITMGIDGNIYNRDQSDKADSLMFLEQHAPLDIDGSNENNLTYAWYEANRDNILIFKRINS